MKICVNVIFFFYCSICLGAVANLKVIGLKSQVLRVLKESENITHHRALIAKQYIDADTFLMQIPLTDTAMYELSYQNYSGTMFLYPGDFTVLLKVDSVEQQKKAFESSWCYIDVLDEPEGINKQIDDINDVYDALALEKVMQKKDFSFDSLLNLFYASKTNSFVRKFGLYSACSFYAAYQHPPENNKQQHLDQLKSTKSYLYKAYLKQVLSSSIKRKINQERIMALFHQLSASAFCDSLLSEMPVYAKHDKDYAALFFLYKASLDKRYQEKDLLNHLQYFIDSKDKDTRLIAQNIYTKLSHLKAPSFDLNQFELWSKEDRQKHVLSDLFNGPLNLMVMCAQNNKKSVSDIQYIKSYLTSKKREVQMILTEISSKDKGAFLADKTALLKEAFYPEDVYAFNGYFDLVSAPVFMLFDAQKKRIHYAIEATEMLTFIEQYFEKEAEKKRKKIKIGER